MYGEAERTFWQKTFTSRIRGLGGTAVHGGECAGGDQRLGNGPAAAHLLRPAGSEGGQHLI